MTDVSLLTITLSWFALAIGYWFGLQLLRQNGRILLRLEELERRLDELEFGESEGEHLTEKSEMDQSLTSAATNGKDDGRAARFSNPSLARSRFKRDGLKVGTPAPGFRLPRLDGRCQLSLEELRGRRVLLVFSDPRCGPCQALAPHLESFHRAYANISVVMISRREPKENQAKVNENGLTFPVLLQQQWEISRLYAMFATPIAYLLDERGMILNDVAVGVEPIQALMATAAGEGTLHSTMDKRVVTC